MLSSCARLTPACRTGDAKDLPPQTRNYAFEVLDVTTEVTAAGAALRVGPRFWYRWAYLGPAERPVTDEP